MGLWWSGYMPVLMAFSQKNKLVQKRNQKNQILKQKKRKEKYTVIQEKDKLASRKKQNRKKKLYGIIIKKYNETEQVCNGGIDWIKHDT